MHVDFEDDEMDLDIQTYSTGAESIDPFDFVYSNLPNRTHILKEVPDCEHCHAKKFEHETDGFCCRNGKIKLANQQPEPIPELRRLWSSQDADSPILQWPLLLHDPWRQPRQQLHEHEVRSVHIPGARLLVPQRAFVRAKLSPGTSTTLLLR